MLLLADDDEGDGTGMTDRQLRDEVMTLFLAGHETTANALTLDLVPARAEPGRRGALPRRARRRARRPRSPTVGDLPALGYVERVFAESMRLFPPAWGLGRRVLADHEIGGYTRARGHASWS